MNELKRHHTGSLSKARHFAFEQGAQIVRRETKPDEKRPEKTIHSAGFVEAHFVDELSEHQRVVGEKIHAPFPIVEADRTRNYLDDPAGILAPDHAMLAHHPLAFCNRFAVPVLTLAAKLVHRVEAKVPSLRNLRPKTRRRGLPLLDQFCLDLPVPLGASRSKPLLDQTPFKFHRGFEEAQFNYRDVGMRRFEKLVKAGVAHAQWGVVQLI